MPNADYNLDNVILRLSSYDAGENPLVQIRDNAGGNVPSGGNVLATLTNPTSQGSGTFNYTFTPSSAFTFMENATYWLYITATSGSVVWRASNPGITPTGIATGGVYRFSSDGGSSFDDSTTLNSFQINATEVNNPPVTTPEPASVVGLIAFSVGLLATKKRKQ